MSIEAPTFHHVGYTLNFLDALDPSQPLKSWQREILGRLLKNARVETFHSPPHRAHVLTLADDALKHFLKGGRIDFARLALFLKLLHDRRQQLASQSLSRWTHLDIAMFTPQDITAAVHRDDIPFWRPSLLQQRIGDVTIRCKGISAVGFRKIFLESETFRKVLEEHPGEPVVHMEELDPLLLSPAFLWSYCQPYSAILSKFKLDPSVKIIPQKDPLEFIKTAPPWLKEAADEQWWSTIFDHYPFDKVVAVLPQVLKEEAKSLQTGARQWVNAKFATLLDQHQKSTLEREKLRLETSLYRASRMVSVLNVAQPDGYLSFERLRTWFPSLQELTLAVGREWSVKCLKEHCFSFPHLKILNLLFQPQADPVVYLDCLSGCPEIEKVKIASIGEPQRHVFCLKKESASPFLPKVRVLEFVGVDFGEGSEHPLFAEIGRINVLEELILRNVERLLPADIRQLVKLQALKIQHTSPQAFNSPILAAVASLKGLASFDLDPLTEELRDEIASSLPEH